MIDCLVCGTKFVPRKANHIYCSPKCNRRAHYRRHANESTFRLRARWSTMKSRCYNPKQSDYKRYGGRGIKVCDEWLNDSEAFIAWALENGFKPNLMIDRIDNGGHYSPENCRWVTLKESNLNRRYERSPQPYKKSERLKISRKILANGKRICGTCKIKKTLSMFHKSKNAAGGHVYMCKKCVSKYNRKRYLLKKRDAKLLAYTNEK